MQNNRSVPPNIILPHIAYENLSEAMAWLTRVFGFTEHFQYGDPVAGAQMFLGDAWMMVRQAGPGQATPSKLGYGTQSLTIFTEDVEEQYRRVKGAGARIVEDLHETEYGERQFGVEDLDGHHWLFARHARDVDPRAWGARVANQKL
jgi:uncharacterized glyoxalase superfamily protein PhnB